LTIIDNFNSITLVMNFFRKIRNSIYSPAFYSNIPQKSLGSAIGYFLLLSLFLTIIQSISPIWKFSTTGQTEIKKFVDQAKNFYPSGLEVKVQKGKVSTNVQEPYYISLPKDKNRTAEDNQNLVVIDTKTPFSVEQYNQYETFAWITENSVITKSENKIQINDLSKTSNITINKTFVMSLINKFSPWLKLITPLVIIGILIGIYITYAGRLIYLFFLALIVWLLAKLFKKPLTYGGSYKIGLHAVTLGFIADLLFGWIHFPGFVFMFTLISLAVVLANMLSKPENISAQPENKPPFQPLPPTQPFQP
jgi:hypothetical protein